jgi:hypothetical protein
MIRVFEIEISIPPFESDGRWLKERFFVMAGTPDDALALVSAREGGTQGIIIRELDDEQRRAFRFLTSAST